MKYAPLGTGMEWTHKLLNSCLEKFFISWPNIFKIEAIAMSKSRPTYEAMRNGKVSTMKETPMPLWRRTSRRSRVGEPYVVGHNQKGFPSLEEYWQLARAHISCHSLRLSSRWFFSICRAALNWNMTINLSTKASPLIPSHCQVLRYSIYL